MTSLKILDVDSEQSRYLYFQKRLPKLGYAFCTISKHRNKLTNELGENQPKFVFIDAAKISYPRFFDLVFGKMVAGGYILIDNMLWSGKVVKDDSDADTVTLRKFAQTLQNDARLENILLPVRDGLMICRKI